MNYINYINLLPNDIHNYIYTFLLYTESTSLQQTSILYFKNKIRMEKYCQHIQPHGIVELYDMKTKTKIWKFNYYEGKLHKLQKQWYDNKQLSSERNYFYGKLHGTTKNWDIYGILWHECNHNYYNNYIHDYYITPDVKCNIG